MSGEIGRGKFTDRITCVTEHPTIELTSKQVPASTDYEQTSCSTAHAHSTMKLPLTTPTLTKS